MLHDDNIGRPVRGLGLGLAFGLSLLLGGCAAVPPAGLVISGVAIGGYGGSSQVRQGAGTITVEVSGSGLADLSDASLGSVAGEGEVVSSSAGAATISFDIVHAAAIGAATLSVAGPAGSASLNGAVTVTAVTADAGSGDDGNLGTPDSPFRTLTHAASVADDGDTVQLLDGTYADSNGGEEVFPVDVSGLTVQGESQAGTVLDGSKSNAGDGLVVLSGPTTVRDLTVNDFGVNGVTATAGPLTLERVTVTNVLGAGILLDGRAGSGFSATLDQVEVSDVGDDGIGVAGATVTIGASSVRDVGDDGLDIYAGSVATAADVTFQTTAEEGVIVSDDSSAVLSSVTISGAGRYGLVVDDNASVTLENSSVAGSADDSVRIRLAGEIDIVGSTIENGASDGIDIQGSGSLYVRDSSVVNNAGSGVEAQGSPDLVDLGNDGDPGNNTVTGNGEFQLHDRRDAGLTAFVLAYGNDFGAVLSGVVTGPGTSGNLWSIENDTSIDFGP